MQKYSLEDKRILKDRIEQLKSIKEKLNIMKIIMQDKNFNFNDISEGDNKCLLYFNKFGEETYTKIEEHLNNITAMTTESMPVFSVMSTTEEEFYNNPVNKFNNKEKQIIKKKLNSEN